MGDQLSEALSQKIIDHLNKSSEKLNGLIAEVSLVNTLLEERINNAKERHYDLRGCVKENRDILQVVQTHQTILEEHQDRIREDIILLKKDMKSIQTLEISQAVQKNKMSSFSKTIGAIVALGISIISTVITLAVNHLISGG